MDLSQYQKTFPHNYIRKAFAGFCHELTHVVMHKINGHFANPYELYKEELVCYRVQAFVERLLTGRFIWSSVEKAAISSVATHISWSYGRPTNWVYKRRFRFR